MSNPYFICMILFHGFYDIARLWLSNVHSSTHSQSCPLCIQASSSLILWQEIGTVRKILKVFLSFFTHLRSFHLIVFHTPNFLYCGWSKMYLHHLNWLVAELFMWSHLANRFLSHFCVSVLELHFNFLWVCFASHHVLCIVHLCYITTFVIHCCACVTLWRYHWYRALLWASIWLVRRLASVLWYSIAATAPHTGASAILA